MNKKTALKITEILSEQYPNPVPALKFSSEYELLVAVILSAQCTDERVNKVTEKLFKVANTPEKMVNLGVEELEKYIFSCGLYHSKATHIVSASKDIIEKFNGLVPSTLKDLQSLAGVGRKTANVVFSVAFGGDAIAVDTHVFRVSKRLGLSKGTTPLDTEKRLMEAFPKQKWSHMHHALIFHGRRVCLARNPKCSQCFLNSLCNYYNQEKRG
ncbi:MAG: endonuclease III [Clostridia bacterium]|nr:endonuclease III [Clostridia bacterium]